MISDVVKVMQERPRARGSNLEYGSAAILFQPGFNSGGGLHLLVDQLKSVFLYFVVIMWII